MAEPIAFEFSARHSPSNSEKKLQEAPLEHAEALLSAMQLLQALHDRGVLSLLRGLVDAGDDVIGIATKAIDTPEAIRGIRNLVLMTQFFASVPPELLNRLLENLREAAERELHSPTPGFFQLLLRLRSEESRRAAAMSLDLLEGLGRSL